MKYGFVLIELIVATLIASMVAGILLTALAQGNRFQTVVDNVVDTSMRIGIISNQLEKDLMGAFIPTQALLKEEEKKEPTQPADKKDSAEQKGAEKKEPKPIEKIFYSTNKDGKLSTLTFITNNPLVVYVGKDVGVVKPKVVRVQYTLKPEPDSKNSYALFRQESMELDLEQYKNVREYEVISGIKNCTVSFTARIEKKEEKPAADNEKASQEKPKISYEYKTLNEWVSEQKKDSDKEKEPFPRIPYSVEIKIALWDKQDKRDKEFTLVCIIPVDFTEPKKEEKTLTQQSKKDETSNAQGDKNNQLPKTAHNNAINGQERVVYRGIETMSGTLQELMKIFGHV